MCTQSEKRKGFTLVELMLVVVIIAILAGTVTLAVIRQIPIAFKSRVTADFRAIKDASKMFRLHVGRYPDSIVELQFGDDIKGWNGPYLDPPPVDPWGVPYIYELTGNPSTPLELKTFGADGKEGGADENTDYSSSEIFNQYANK